MMTVDDFTLYLIRIVITASIILITRYTIPAIKAYISNSKYEWIASVIMDAVEQAEQTIKEEKSGAKKKAFVIEIVCTIFHKAGINVTTEQIDSIIESAVFSMNKEKK